jgi:hypothetical protein
MRETSNIDQSIVNKLDALANLFKEHKEKWLLSPNTKINLYFYYAARIAELIVSRMKEKFISSQAGANSSIAEDSLQLVALLGEVLGLTQKKLPDEESTKLVIERTKQLRAVATDKKLLQSQEKELEDVDKLLGYLSRLRR